MKSALRLFTKNPAFAALAILTLALGIGANTAIFTVANALLLQPLHYADPDRLVLISAERKVESFRLGPLSFPRYQQLEGHSRSFESLAAFAADAFNITGRGDPEQILGARVSANFFATLGVQPALGRAFTAAEGVSGAAPVVILSGALWSRRFASDPAAIGQPLTLDGKDYNVIGVLPAGFRFDFLGPRVDLYVPHVDELNALQPAQIQAGAGYLNYVGRLSPGVTVARAQAEMDALARQFAAERPTGPDTDPSLAVRAGNLRDETVSGVRPAILILFGAVALVLLIACANVASLLLSRALGRQRELAVRTALGASRGSIVRQLLAESLLLALLGGACGALLGYGATRVIASMAGASLPRAQEIHMDATVLAFTFLVSVVAGALFGLAPALQISRSDLNSALRSEARGSTAGRRRNTLRSLLVISQVALSTLLLIGAGLLIRNFIQLGELRLGFDPANVLTMNVALPIARYSRVQEPDFFRDLLARVRVLPGVTAAGATSALPLSTTRRSPALPEGYPAVPLGQRPLFNIQAMTPGYVEAIRGTILRGRAFTEHDGPKDPPVALVNETVARTFFRDQDPIGKHILLGRMTAAAEIVGVLTDVRNRGFTDDTSPEIFLPFAQLPWPFMRLAVRTQTDPHRLVQAVRAQVTAMDRDLPVTAIQTMDEVMASTSTQPRFTTILLGALSATALILALIGIYGVIAYSVAQRTQEMGIRLALGASRADILRLVLRQGLILAVFGIALGMAAALALTRYLGSLLYHVSATDPWIFASGAVLFAAVALLASYIPARRATHVDPIVALR
ncbi:MAG TPA: ABC transporter permease [Candidatus Sulfopaludibacter sp.]|jgi:putative ABC transport system permease protein|nr:ABC transporter permease [Candidatus Sulfopaludibacter sp.]